MTTYTIDAQEMLKIHPCPKAVAVGFRRGIAAEILEHAEQSGMRIEPRRRFLILDAVAADRVPVSPPSESTTIPATRWPR